MIKMLFILILESFIYSSRKKKFFIIFLLKKKGGKRVGFGSGRVSERSKIQKFEIEAGHFKSLKKQHMHPKFQNH